MSLVSRMMSFCVVAVLLLIVVWPRSSDAQLTQSLGWGSAGSPGKRASFLFGDPCRISSDAVQDVIVTIQKEAERLARCRKEV